MDLQRRDRFQGGGDPVDRDSEDGDVRQDLRRGRAREADSPVVQDPGKRRPGPSGGQDYAGAPARDLRIHGQEGEGGAHPGAGEALSL